MGASHSGKASGSASSSTARIPDAAAKVIQPRVCKSVSSSKAQTLSTLSSFLSTKNITSSLPSRLPLASLYNSYRLLKSAPHVRKFIAAHSDVLLDVLGTLLTEGKSPFGSRLSLDVARSLVGAGIDERDLLAKFIIRVGADKIRCSHVLGPSHRYWLLRAYLTELQSHLATEEPLSGV